jgi:hypothetical protein
MVSFADQVQSILKQTSPGMATDKISRSQTLDTSRLQHESYSLPPRVESDAMLTVFWTLVFPLYPFIDREEFDRTYSSLWTPSGGKQAASLSGPYTSFFDDHTEHLAYEPASGNDVPQMRRFHVLLNMMYALGISFDLSETPVFRAQRGDFYWRRCKSLLELDFDIFNQPTLTFIQALLYMSIYLMCAEELTAASWNLVGCAIRLSQSLGLHRMVHHNYSARNRNERRQSLRWHVWASCVMMDRYCSPLCLLSTLISS